MKKVLTFLLALCLLVLSVSCSKETLIEEKLGGIRLESGEEIHPQAFLTFDGTEVSFTEFRYFYLNYKDMYLKENPDYFDSEEKEEALKEEVLSYLLDQYAVRFLAKDAGIRLSSDDKKSIDAEIEKVRASYESEDAFREDLEKSYTCPSHYRAMLEYSALSLNLFDALYGQDGKEVFSDEEFVSYFKEHYLAVQEIHLPFGEGETADSCEASLSLANNILKEIEDGADFWKMVEKYGKDENMLNFPDGYYFTKGQAEDELYEACTALAIGEISKPVVTSSGIYLIRRMELRDIRMEENRQSALYGYYDSFNDHHAGAYDDLFYEKYHTRAQTIRVEKSQYWNEVSTKAVY